MCITYLFMTSRAYLQCFYIEKWPEKEKIGGQKWEQKYLKLPCKKKTDRLLGAIRLGFLIYDHSSNHLDMLL